MTKHHAYAPEDVVEFLRNRLRQALTHDKADDVRAIQKLLDVALNGPAMPRS